MHVAPADFRSVRRDRVSLRLAVLGETAFVIADLPATGTAGTFLEEPCTRPHWAVIVSGRLDVELGGRGEPIEAGVAVHVPPGLEHRLSARGSATIGAFEPLGPGRRVDDEALQAAGFEVVRPSPMVRTALLPPQPAAQAPAPEPGRIVASAVPMGERIFTRARFGSRSGYTTPYCDLEHWGLVTAGSLALEWEDDVEVVAAGDVFHCPPGPPGHRFLAADEAAIIDFTPSGTVAASTRMSPWRPLLPRTVERRRRPRPITTVVTAPML